MVQLTLWASSKKGSIQLFSMGALTVKSATTFDGNIDILANDLITAQNISSQFVMLTSQEASIDEC